VFKLFGRGDEQRPWPSDLPSLLQRIREAPETPDGLDLEVSPPEGTEIRWAAGAFDALLGKPDASERQVSARALASALGAQCRRPSAGRYRHLYELMGRDDAITVVDGLLGQLGRAGVEVPQVARVARQIATEAPNLGPVKLAISLLGMAGDSRDMALLHDLGRFEELTLYAVVAMCNLLHDPDRDVWRLAQATRGWGRIQAVYRLKDTEDPEIKAWLLREGHYNSVMAEEIAYVCATAGGLREALESPKVDDALLDAAGDLIVSLLNGGPAEDIHDYADGPAVLVLYVSRLNESGEASLARLNAVNRIRAFADDVAQRPDWSSQVLFDLRTGTAAYLARPAWREMIDAALNSADRATFFGAVDAAPAFGIDAWPHHFARQQNHRAGDWYWLMQTDDRERIEAVVALAEAQLDLAKVGSGPSLSLGLGPDYEDDSALDFVVQDLRRFAGVGWSLVKVALRGRSVRLRNMAIKALDAWTLANWPEDAQFAVREAKAREPDPDVARRFDAILVGRPID